VFGEMAPQSGIDAVVNAAKLVFGEMAPQSGIDAVANAAK